MYTDETVLTFGAHRGKTLENVPGAWLVWYYENATNPDPKLIAYIADVGIDTIKKYG